MEPNKKGPKIKETYYCTCCHRQFSNSSTKCKHESYMRNKKARTEVGSVIGDNSRMGDFF